MIPAFSVLKNITKNKIYINNKGFENYCIELFYKINTKTINYIFALSVVPLFTGLETISLDLRGT